MTEYRITVTIQADDDAEAQNYADAIVFPSEPVAVELDSDRKDH